MRTREGQAKVLKEHEFQQVIDHVARTSRFPERDIALLQISYRAMLRVKEIAGLSLDDILAIDGSINQTITLRKTTTKGSKGGKAYFSHPDLRSALSTYVQKRLQMECKSRVLFISQKGSQFSSNSLCRVFTTLYNRAHAYGCTSHTGRRSGASNLMRGGAHIYQIKSILRHENIQTTARYIEEDEETLAQLIRNV